MPKIFIDTNILVYSLDQFEEEKQKKCRNLLKRLTGEYQGVISTQVMQEFLVASTKKLGADALIVKDILHAFERFETVIITLELVKTAIDCSIINKLSFWDALIVISAEAAKCEKIWSEDLNDGQLIRGVRIENPLVIPRR